MLEFKANAALPTVHQRPENLLFGYLFGFVVGVEGWRVTDGGVGLYNGRGVWFELLGDGLSLKGGTPVGEVSGVIAHTVRSFGSDAPALRVTGDFSTRIEVILDAWESYLAGERKMSPGTS